MATVLLKENVQKKWSVKLANNYHCYSNAAVMLDNQKNIWSQ